MMSGSLPTVATFFSPNQKSGLPAYLRSGTGLVSTCEATSALLRRGQACGRDYPVFGFHIKAE